LNIEKKVAFVGPMPPPLGGVAIMNRAFQELVNDTYDIFCFNTSRGNEREDLYNTNKIKNILPQIIKMKAFVAFAKNDSYNIANLFVTTGFGFIREAFFIFVLKLFNKRIIVHLHSKKHGEYFLSKSRIRILAYFLNKTDKIIVLSDDHYKYFSQYFDKEKMTVIENFVDYEKYSCSMDDKYKEFLYVGRLSEKKGFFDLLDSIEILKNKGLMLKIHILGAPENDYVEQEIDRKISEKGITKYLEFHGLKYGKEKYELFKKCTYFVFPSHFENSPVVLKEAIASKMAIITSDLDANQNVLKVLDDFCLFRTGDANDLAKTIMSIVNNEKRTHLLMEKASKTTLYDKSIAKTKLMALINDLREKGSL